MDKYKKRMLRLLALFALVLFSFACTKKDNLTGVNWAGDISHTFTDKTAIKGGYSFVADELSTTDPGLKGLLVGSWQGSSAQSLLRFSALPSTETLAGYESISEAKLELVALRRDAQPQKEPLSLEFYKMLGGYAHPDSVDMDKLQYIGELEIPAEISSQDTLSLDLDAAEILNWPSEADSTALNIFITLKEAQEGFVEFRLSTFSEGAKLSFKYQMAADSEIESFNTHAIRQDIRFSATESGLLPEAFRISNFRFQRSYLDLDPVFTRFVDFDGTPLDSLALKRVNINKAELILHIKDLPNKSNTYSYFLKSYLVKERPDSLDAIPTADLESISFYQSLQKQVLSTADSVAINITPIIQAYTSGKKEAQGIVLKSSYEKKDFGELEFYHPLDAETEKHPYIRVKYSAPYL